MAQLLDIPKYIRCHIKQKNNYHHQTTKLCQRHEEPGCSDRLDDKCIEVPKCFEQSNLAVDNNLRSTLYNVHAMSYDH